MYPPNTETKRGFLFYYPEIMSSVRCGVTGILLVGAVDHVLLFRHHLQLQHAFLQHHLHHSYSYTLPRPSLC